MNTRRIALVVCIWLALAQPLLAQRAPDSKGHAGLYGPDETAFVGFGYGLLATTGVWIGEGILGAEFEHGLLAPPFSWINVLAGSALCTAVAVTDPHHSRTARERAIAAGVTGTIIGVHGALSLLSLLGQRGSKGPDLDLALSIDPRAGPAMHVAGAL